MVPLPMCRPYAENHPSWEMVLPWLVSLLYMLIVPGGAAVSCGMAGGLLI